MADEKRLLVLDIGGSAIKYGFWDGEEIGGTGKVPTPCEDLDGFVAAVDGVVEEAGEVRGLAISAPGRIDVERGAIIDGGAVRCMRGQSFKELLGPRYDLPVSVFNDGKAAALAEIGYGCLRDIANAIVVVFGTGIGGGIVINHDVVIGAHRAAGELSGLCGNMDEVGWPSLFAYQCGIHGLAKEVEVAGGPAGLDGIGIFKLVREGSEAATAGLRSFCEKAAFHFFNLQSVTDPEVFAIGGGISNDPLFLDYLREAVDAVGERFPYYFAKPTLIPCTFRSDANLVGAAYHFEREHEDVGA